MKTFRNKNFIKRDYECTNIVFCQSLSNTDPPKWDECTESEIKTRNCIQLFKENDIIYFGYL